MAQTRLCKLSEDTKRYNKAYLLFRKLSDQTGAMKRWIHASFVPAILPKLNVQLSDGGRLCTLGIGSGAGENECLLLKQLLPKFPHIDNHVVEPSTEFIAKYKDRVSTNSSELKGVNSKWHQLRLEDHCQKRVEDGDTAKFHVISAIHSMYHVSGELGKWLNYLYGLLEEGGMLVVILTADTSGFSVIRREFPQISSEVKFSGIDSGHVRRYFDKTGIVHYDSVVRNRVEMPTECFYPEISPISSTETDLMIDFVAQWVDFRKNGDGPLRERFIKFLGSDKCVEIGDDGLRLMIDDWGVTVAHRKSYIK